MGHGLGKVERLTLHLDVFAEVLITVHAGGEELVVRNIARNSGNTRGHASVNFDESGSRRHSLVPGGSVKVWGSIINSSGGSVSK